MPNYIAKYHFQFYIWHCYNVIATYFALHIQIEISKGNNAKILTIGRHLDITIGDAQLIYYGL